jgi:hypothetical protein
MKLISSALVKAQAEMSNPVKGSSNPFFKSKYADLNAVREAVLPVLNEHGIVVLQPIVHVDGRNFVKTILLHESGEQIESLTEILYSKQNDAQAQGSGISYARRYGLQSFVCVGADDDDGNDASKAKTTPPASTLTSEKKLAASTTLEGLRAAYLALSKDEQKRTEAYKDELKSKLTA